MTFPIESVLSARNCFYHDRADSQLRVIGRDRRRHRGGRRNFVKWQPEQRLRIDNSRAEVGGVPSSGLGRARAFAQGRTKQLIDVRPVLPRLLTTGIAPEIR